MPARDLESMSMFPAMMNLADDLTDFGETAAVVENLDLVITVDTSMGHLAGALGKPAWILIPKAADWRWMLEREDSPWYPSVRLFRQQKPGAWDQPLDRLRSALGRELAGAMAEGAVAG
jgi:ADP-heptose:LPS heptosyltransferase